MLTLVENVEEYRAIAKICRKFITETCEALKNEHHFGVEAINMGSLRNILMTKDEEGTYQVHWYIVLMRYPKEQLRKPRQTRMLIHKILGESIKKRYKVQNRQPLNELRYKFTDSYGKSIDLHVGILANDKRNSYYIISYDKDELAYTWTELKRKIQNCHKMIPQIKDEKRMEDLRQLYIAKVNDKAYSRVPVISIFKECVDILYYHKEEQ